MTTKRDETQENVKKNAEQYTSGQSGRGSQQRQDQQKENMSVGKRENQNPNNMRPNESEKPGVEGGSKRSQTRQEEEE